MQSLTNFLRLTLFCTAVLGGSLQVAGAQTSNNVHITSPATGTVVSPGGIVEVKVETTIPVRGVFILGENFVDRPEKGSPPFTFSLLVPANIIGPKNITAVAITSDNKVLYSPSVLLNIEPTVGKSVVSIWAQPDEYSLRYAGAQVHLDFTATFSDRSTATVTKSSELHLVTRNPAVVVTGPRGLLTATGPGETEIDASYGGATMSVRITVPAAARGDFNVDGIVDYKDVTHIQSYLNTVAIKPNDARDLNGDGKIDDLDVRILKTLCTYPQCGAN